MSYSLVADAWGPSWEAGGGNGEAAPRDDGEAARALRPPRISLYEAKPLLMSPFPWLVLFGTLILGLLINVNVKVGTLCRRLEMAQQLRWGPTM